MKSVGFSLDSALMDFPASPWASRRASLHCRFGQDSALVPKKGARSKAVSPVLAHVPFKICVTPLAGTSILRALPGSSTSSAKCSPGWIAGGGIVPAPPDRRDMLRDEHLF